MRIRKVSAELIFHMRALANFMCEKLDIRENKDSKCVINISYVCTCELHVRKLDICENIQRVLLTFFILIHWQCPYGKCGQLLRLH